MTAMISKLMFIFAPLFLLSVFGSESATSLIGNHRKDKDIKKLMN